MTKLDWIAAAAARYAYHGLSGVDAWAAANALCDDYNSRIIPAVCVDKDIVDREKQLDTVIILAIITVRDSQTNNPRNLCKN